MYIYIYRQRERDRDICLFVCLFVCLFTDLVRQAEPPAAAVPDREDLSIIYMCYIGIIILSKYSGYNSNTSGSNINNNSDTDNEPIAICYDINLYVV